MTCANWLNLGVISDDPKINSYACILNTGSNHFYCHVTVTEKPGREVAKQGGKPGKKTDQTINEASLKDAAFSKQLGN